MPKLEKKKKNPKNGREWGNPTRWRGKKKKIHKLSHDLTYLTHLLLDKGPVPGRQGQV